MEPQIVSDTVAEVVSEVVDSATDPNLVVTTLQSACEVMLTPEGAAACLAGIFVVAMTGYFVSSISVWNCCRKRRKGSGGKSSGRHQRRKNNRRNKKKSLKPMPESEEVSAAKTESNSDVPPAEPEQPVEPKKTKKKRKSKKEKKLREKERHRRQSSKAKSMEPSKTRYFSPRKQSQKKQPKDDLEKVFSGRSAMANLPRVVFSRPGPAKVVEKVPEWREPNIATECKSEIDSWASSLPALASESTSQSREDSGVFPAAVVSHVTSGLTTRSNSPPPLAVEPATDTKPVRHSEPAALSIPRSVSMPLFPTNIPIVDFASLSSGFTLVPVTDAPQFTAPPAPVEAVPEQLPAPTPSARAVSAPAARKAAGAAANAGAGAPKPARLAVPTLPAQPVRPLDDWGVPLQQPPPTRRRSSTIVLCLDSDVDTPPAQAKSPVNAWTRKSMTKALVSKILSEDEVKGMKCSPAFGPIATPELDEQGKEDMMITLDEESESAGSLRLDADMISDSTASGSVTASGSMTSTSAPTSALTAPKSPVPKPMTPRAMKPQSFRMTAIIATDTPVMADIKPKKLTSINTETVYLTAGTKVTITERMQNLLHVVEPVEGWILEKIGDRDMLEHRTSWKPSLYPKSDYITDITPERVVGVSYVVPSRLPTLPHVSIRPAPTEEERKFKPAHIDLPEVIWTAIPVQGMSRDAIQKMCDEYIMHPPFPRKRGTIVKDHGASYEAAKRLPVQDVPELVKQGHVVIAHFFLDENTNNMFPFNANAEIKAERSNLLLVFRGHTTEEGYPVAECEYFIPRVMWMTMDNQHRMNLHDLADRTASDIVGNWDQRTIPLVPARRAMSHEMLELSTSEDVVIFHPRGAGVDINLSSTLTVGRTEFFFGKNELPESFAEWKRYGKASAPNPITQNLDVEPIGLVRYDGMFHDYELKALEEQCDLLRDEAERKKLKPTTAHNTIMKGGNRRTKYFFNARYLWTKEQLEETECDRAGGIRTDVDTYPAWMQFVIDRLVLVGVVPQDYVNAVALNMYHDGTIGIGLHQDCYSRFERPIITLRLFSPARLTLGGKALGDNAVCIVDLPRGAILSMEKDSYAADGVKHCVRNCDMVGKSAAMILRHCHKECLEEANAMRSESLELTAG